AYYVGQAGVTGATTGSSSRVHDRLVRRERLAKSVSCSILPLTSGATMLLMVATGYDRSRLDALETAMAEELDGLASLEQHELDRAVAITETRTLSQLQRVGSRADLLSMFATVFGDPERLNRDLWRLRDVTLKEVKAWGERYMGPSNRVIVRYIPEEA
ncbi:MAG: insulinase family protein, partial [Gemmatimonadetes bacterium]|nr:insulinase family protein [Gemmatimonadota bacterium]